MMNTYKSSDITPNYSVVMTACIDHSNSSAGESVKRSNPKICLKDYEDSLKFWLWTEETLHHALFKINQINRNLSYIQFNNCQTAEDYYQFSTKYIGIHQIKRQILNFVEFLQPFCPQSICYNQEEPILVHRVLIVSPHFPPINAADHQRVRMSLPYFEEFGWEPHVLAVRPDCVEAVQDSLLLKTVPSHIPVTYTGALPIQQTRRIGMSSLGLRCIPYLLRTGDRLLHQKKFDLIYFSTTVFIVMALSHRWHKRFGVPYVLDCQDPWLSDYYKKSGASLPPGGRLKYEFSQLQAKLVEPKVLSKVSHVISVSPAYPKTLQQRYPHLRPEQFTVLPFGAPEKDFEQLPGLNLQQQIFDRNDGKRHWVYVGRGGNDMVLALRALFLGIQSERHRHPEQWHSVQLHFVGTSYAPKDRAVKTVEPIAQELGVADLVTEHTHRIPYFEALQVLIDSDAILLIGSNDSGYTASKLYPCILACKPILAIFHQQSSVVNILHRCQAGRAITFAPENQPQDLLAQVTVQLQKLLSLPKGYQPETNWTAFQPYTAREMTRKQCAIFDQCLT